MSEVYFVSLENNSDFEAEKKILEYFPKIFNPYDQVAIKVHFGEEGNKTFISSEYLKLVIKKITSFQVQSFVTDTNVLYRSKRRDTISHLKLAYEHGFSIENLKIPVIIADGLKGRDVDYVNINAKYFKKFPIGGAIKRANGFIVFSHFKGHLLAGAGGAIKNLSMGCASKAGKQIIHSDVICERRESIKCVFCNSCINICPVNAIYLNSTGPVFDLQKCIGCGECIAICPVSAIKIQWEEVPEIFSEKLAEGALAAVIGKEKKSVYINCLLNITPECDCMADAGEKFVDNIGFMMSTDPVSLDFASYEKVLEVYNKNNKIPKDPFKEIHPNTDFVKTLKYAEELGLGELKYNIIEIK